MPLRLRGAIVLLGASAGAAALVGWAFAMTGLSTDELPIEVRADAGHELGALLLLMLALLLALGLAAGFLAAERPASPDAKRIAGRVLLGVLAVIPVILLIALASAPGGIDGQVSEGLGRAHEPERGHARQHAGPPHRDLLGARALLGGGVRRAWPLSVDRDRRGRVRDGAQPLQDRAAVRAPRPRLRAADAGGPRLGGARALAAGARALGLGRGPRRRTAAARPRAAVGRRARRHGDAGRDRAGVRRELGRRLDLVRAGQRADGAARGGLGDRAPAAAHAARGRRARVRRARAAARDRSRDGGPLWAPPASEPAPPLADVAGPGAVPVAEAQWRRRAPFPWLPAGAAVLVLALALAAGWAAFQPVRSLHAGDAAIERLERGALDAAVSIAGIAHDRNPLSPEPLWELGYIEQQRGRLANAEEALEEAVRLQPANAETWRRLGRFRLSTLNQPADALAVVPRRVLPRPAQPGVDVGLPRGEPRQRPARGAAAR